MTSPKPKKIKTWWIDFGNKFDHVAWELPVTKSSIQVVSMEDYVNLQAQAEMLAKCIQRNIDHGFDDIEDHLALDAYNKFKEDEK